MNRVFMQSKVIIFNFLVIREVKQSTVVSNPLLGSVVKQSTVDSNLPLN